MTSFRALDVDQNRAVTRAEIQGDLDFGPRFDDMDINRDGVMTMEELQRYLEFHYGGHPARRRRKGALAPACEAASGSSRRPRGWLTTRAGAAGVSPITCPPPAPSAPRSPFCSASKPRASTSCARSSPSAEKPVMLYSIGKDSSVHAAPGDEGVLPGAAAVSAAARGHDLEVPRHVSRSATAWRARLGLELLVHVNPGGRRAGHQPVHARLGRCTPT